MSNWLGFDSKGGPLQITESEMSKWAMNTDRVFSVGWSDSYQFSEGSVSNQDLKGARVVRQSRDGKKHSEVAAAAGWGDLAEALQSAGF